MRWLLPNTNKIADMCEEILPIPEGTFPPKIEGAEEEIKTLSEAKAKEIYGEKLPEIVKKRMEKELNSIIKNGFSVMYIISQKLVCKIIRRWISCWFKGVGRFIFCCILNWNY